MSGRWELVTVRRRLNNIVVDWNCHRIVLISDEARQKQKHWRQSDNTVESTLKLFAEFFSLSLIPGRNQIS